MTILRALTAVCQPGIGIGLLAEQWQALVQGFPALADALDAHGA